MASRWNKLGNLKIVGEMVSSRNVVNSNASFKQNDYADRLPDPKKCSLQPTLKKSCH